MSTISYLVIANNDYKYFVKSIDYTYLNPSAIQAQQVIEKYLKYLVETFCVDESSVPISALRSHNLITLNRALINEGIDLGLDRGKLALISGFYFDMRYPGENFYYITKEEFDESLEFVKEVRNKVLNYLRDHGVCPECGGKLSASGMCTNLLCDYQQ